MSKTVKLSFGYRLMEDFNYSIKEILGELHPTGNTEITWNDKLQKVFVKNEFQSKKGYESIYYAGSYENIRKKDLGVRNWPKIDIKEYEKSNKERDFKVSYGDVSVVVRTTDAVRAIQSAILRAPIKEWYIKDGADTKSDGFIINIHCEEE